MELWSHQRRALELATAEGVRDYALFHEMGTGKTRTTLCILKTLAGRNGGRLPRTVILCPKVVVENWRREALALGIARDEVAPLVGPVKKRVKTFYSKARIFVTNYEASQMGELWGALTEWRPEVVVCDESQRLKSPQSLRSKRIAKLADFAKHRYILSGSPVLNSPLDIFQQFRVLDSGETFGCNFYFFRAKYFVDRNVAMPKHAYFPNWQIRPGAYEELNRIIYKKAMRVTKAECLDLPPLVKTRVEVEMGAAQAKAYREMAQHLVTYLSDSACVAQLALTKALRLQQIVSGFAKTEDGRETAFEDNPRVDALKDLLEDLAEGHKVIVWAVFKQNYAAIRGVCVALGLRSVELTGETPDKDRQPAIDAFQTDPAVRVMIANQGAGGVGVTLTAASYSVYFSRGFSLEHDLQSESRNHRGGSEIHEKITRVDLVAPGTIDDLVLDALASKQNIADRILQWRDQL